MAYCTVTEVLSQVSKGTFTDPTTAEIEGFINSTAGMIDAIIKGHGFEVPVLNTATVYSMLKECNLNGASSKTLTAWAKSEHGMGDREKEWWSRFTSCLKRLEDNPSIIDGVTVASEAVVPVSNAAAQGTDNDAKFTRTMKY